MNKPMKRKINESAPITQDAIGCVVYTKEGNTGLIKEVTNTGGAYPVQVWMLDGVFRAYTLTGRFLLSEPTEKDLEFIEVKPTAPKDSFDYFCQVMGGIVR